MDRNATRFALLGLLTLCPEGATGYELRQLAAQSIGYFWNESYGQIYPTLKRLHHDKLVTARNEASGRRDRIVYSITAPGHKALAHWLAQPARLQPPRNEVLLKLFFGPELTPEQNAGRIRTLQASFQKRLALMEQIDRELNEKYADQPGLPYWLMTLDFGRRFSRMWLEWSESTLHSLETLGNGRRRKTPRHGEK